jgi:hypothetical protein
LEEPDVRVARAPLGNFVHSSIVASIIDYENLVLAVPAAESMDDSAENSIDISSFVKGRYDKGKSFLG